MTGEENPFYEYYDEILDICQEYDVTISLGDACRPGCLADGSDVCQIEELVRLGELTKRAWEKNVQVMVEGHGTYATGSDCRKHGSYSLHICSRCTVLCTWARSVTDIAPGYDHITISDRRSRRRTRTEQPSSVMLHRQSIWHFQIWKM